MKIARSIVGVVLGWIVSQILITGVEIGNFLVFRTDTERSALEQMQEFSKDSDALKAFVESLPPSAMAIVLAGWAGGAFFGGGVSAMIAGRWHKLHAGIIGSVVLAGVVLNALNMKAKFDVSHPAWMIIGGLLLPLPMSILAGKLVSLRSPSPEAVNTP